LKKCRDGLAGWKGKVHLVFAIVLKVRKNNIEWNDDDFQGRYEMMNMELINEITKQNTST
jgi:hypothetical protein